MAKIGVWCLRAEFACYGMAGNSTLLDSRLLPESFLEYDRTVCRMTEKQKAVAAIVIVGLNVGLGVVLSRLDEVFSFFVMMISVPICASLAWAVGWYPSVRPPIHWLCPYR